MRQLWLLGESPRTLSALTAALKRLAPEVEYRLQVAATLDEIPAEHLSDPGVSYLLDAFHAPLPGFEGLRALRSRHAKGAAFLFGEPAPEEAVEPFKQLGLTAFFPPFERLDMSLAAGLIHYQLHFTGDLDLKHLLEEGGRSAVERIGSIKDFNQLILKLMNFVQRFGVNVQKLKRTVVALSASHVKNTAKGPHVINAFRLCYGVDARKLLVAVSLDLPSARPEDLLQEFVGGVAQVRAPKPQIRSTRPDLHNSARIAGNQVLIQGSAVAGGNSAGHAYLLAALPFSKDGTPSIDPYFFAMLQVQPTPELNQAKESAPAFFEPQVTGDDTERSLEEMSQELEENETVRIETRSPPEAAESVSSLPTNVDELQKELSRALEELRKMETLSQSLASDMKRLLKERRTPQTDPELREALAETQKRIQQLQAEAKDLQAQVEARDMEIKLLKAQLARLKAA